MFNGFRVRKLTRDQLAKFLPDHEAIKVFEQITSNAGEILPDNVDQLAIDIGSTSGNANSALAGLVALGQILELLEIEPAQQAVKPDESALLFPPIEPPKRKRYGAFSDSTTQTAAIINTAYAVTWNTTSISNGVSVGTPTSRIIVDEPGVYNFQFSAQLDNTAATIVFFDLWARVNGVDVPNSNGRVRIQSNNAELVASWEFLLQMNAGDYFELMWAADATTAVLQAFAASAPKPATPSVTLAVTNAN